ncbi:MAG TPA: sigma-70 family RNA polymerase sigma factor [Blastocatellia bacterium]|nr:sigma-70 family RNA polymerase sigma factor [Blastocatellia bacterium]
MKRIPTESFNEKYATEVRAIFETAESVISGFSVSYDSFAERVRRSVEKEVLNVEDTDIDDRSSVVEFIAKLKADDLYLATACDHGDESAWQCFHDRYRRLIERTASQFCSSSADAEDLSAALLSDLFLPTDDGEVKTRIGRYSGLGSLQGWLKVMVHNRAIDRYRRTVTTSSIDDQDGSKEWERVVAVNEDPVESIVEQKYLSTASRALKASLDALDTKDKLLLVFYYRDGLTLKEIAALPSFKVHEATISRWLEKIHKNVRKEFEKRLTRDEKLKLAEIRECCAIAMKRGVLEIRQYLEKAG